MAIIVELEEITGWEIVPYIPLNQEVTEFRDNSPIYATPISSYAPQQVHDEGNESSRKRKRYTNAQLVDEVDKDFTLVELYKSQNIQQIVREQGLTTTIDPQVFLQSLTGWTVETVKRPDGKNDKFYRHPTSTKKLRSLVEVRKFINEKSRKTCSNNGEGSPDAVAERFNDNTYMPIPRNEAQSVDSRHSVIEHNVYLEQFEMLKRVMNRTEGQGR